MPRLGRSFFRRDPVTLAKALLGQRLVRMHDGHRLAGIIVETEAYLGVPDKAAHTFGGRNTARVASMWKEGGTAYVYFTYGMHYCMNVVAGDEGDPVAVLLRALEPVEGLERMRENRGARITKDTQLCSGPARLCEALAIDRELDGTDLTMSDALFIEQVRARPLSDRQIVKAPRVGVHYAGEWASKPLRFYMRDSAHVSKKV
jgi:DNA-3-methyladenine glycosylase